MTIPTVNPLLTLLAFAISCYIAAAQTTRFWHEWAWAGAIVTGVSLALRLSELTGC